MVLRNNRGNNNENHETQILIIKLKKCCGQGLKRESRNNDGGRLTLVIEHFVKNPTMNNSNLQCFNKIIFEGSNKLTIQLLVHLKTVRLTAVSNLPEK